jgi:hypothetical protein
MTPMLTKNTARISIRQLSIRQLSIRQLSIRQLSIRQLIVTTALGCLLASTSHGQV